MVLQDILNKYETIVKNFSFYDFSEELSKLSEEEKNTFEIKSELLAASFSDGGNNDWNTYYGPTTIWTRKDTGELVYMPDWRDITQEDIAYWKRRIKETHNPFFCMRYTGLLWDFEKKVCATEPDFNGVRLLFINSAIEIVEKDLAEHPISGMNYICIAIERAINYRNKTIAQKAIEVMLDYVAKYSDDDKPGIWQTPFDMLIKHSSYFSSFENTIISENQERFKRLLDKCRKFGKTTDSYVHLLMDEIKLFAEYYRRKNDKQQISFYLDIAYECIKCSFVCRGAMWTHGMLQNLQNLYRKYNLDAKANRIFIDIQNLGQVALGEMSGQEYSIPLDKEKLNAYFTSLLSGTVQEVLRRYIVIYIPNLEKEKERQKREEESTPLLSMVHTVFYDWSGMPLNHLGGEKNEASHKFSYGMYRRMVFDSFFMELHISKMEEKNIYCYDEIMAQFAESLLIKKEQRDIFERAIKAYFDEDYIVTCHFLIPLFESSIRTLAAYHGIDVLSNRNASSGNEYKTLDKLFEKLKSFNKIPEDVMTYWQNVYTDKYGWNIRNLFCHGLLQTSRFNKELADRLVHTFLTLSMIKIDKMK